MCGFLQSMMGSTRVLDSKMMNIVGPFNHLLEGKVLVVVNELNGAMSEAEAGIFKSLITDKKLVVNAKHALQYQINSVARFIGTTNGVATMPSDRRPIYFASSLELRDPDNRDKLAAMWKLSEQTERHVALYRYFQNINLVERFHLPTPSSVLRCPTNTRNKELRETRTTWISFVKYLVETKYKDLFEVRITESELRALYIEWGDLFHVQSCATESVYNVTNNVVWGISWKEGSISDKITNEGGWPYRRFNVSKMKETLSLIG
jgi:hypothetical protein